MSHGARADDFHQRARRDARPDAAQVRVERPDRHRHTRRQAGAFGPPRRQPAHGAVNAVCLWPQPRPQLAHLRIKLRQELGIRVTAPGVVIHRLVPGGAYPNGQPVRVLGAGEHGGHPIRAFHPQVSGIEHLGAGAQTMEDLAEEPFAGIRAAALGQILRPQLARQRRDLACLGYPRVVLPKPGHRCGVLGELPVECERLAVAVHRQRRAACSVHPNADNLVRRKAAHRPLRLRERLLDRHLRPGDVVSRVLPGKIGIAREDDSLRAVFIIPDR